MIRQEFSELHNHLKVPSHLTANLVNTGVTVGMSPDLWPGDAYLKLDPPGAFWATEDEGGALRITSQVRTPASVHFLVGPQLPGRDGAGHEIERMLIETTERDVTVGGLPHSDALLCLGDLSLKTTDDGELRVHDAWVYAGPLYLDQIDSRVTLDNVWLRMMKPGFRNLLGR